MQAVANSPTPPRLPRSPQLMEGAAGEALLGRLQPSLVGRGALLNVGEMRVSLPAAAAAMLLPGRPGATAGGAAWPAGVGVARDAARAMVGMAGGVQGGPTPPPRQARITGAGSGGGRLVPDSEDW